jgi:hypothetical protein
MSFEAMSWATTQRKYKGLDKFVLVMMSSYASKDIGKFFYRRQTIADDCGLCLKTTGRIILKLAEDGMLLIKHKRRADGKQGSSVYYLNLVRLQNLADDFKADREAERKKALAEHGFEPFPDEHLRATEAPECQPVQAEENPEGIRFQSEGIRSPLGTYQIPTINQVINQSPNLVGTGNEQKTLLSPDGETGQGDVQKPKAQKPKAPPCPHLEIIAVYNRCLPSLVQPLVHRWPGSVRAKNLEARWKEDVKHQNLVFWERYFTGINRLPHQMGENQRGWKADMGWLVKRDRFDEMVERITNAGRG